MNKQLTTAFKTLTEESNIELAIVTFLEVLQKYRNDSKIKNNRYMVLTELDQLTKETQSLKNRLSDLLEQSENWEFEEKKSK